MSELYQLPDGWKLRELKTVCTFINGRAYKQAELLSDGKYPVLRVGNLFTNNSWYYSDLELPRDKYCDQGDLLYAWSASFGPKIWDGVKSIFHYHIWKIEPDYSAVTKLYLYWLLYWDVNQIKADFGSGTTMIHITKGAIESRKVPLPSISEQKMIVHKLDALFGRIDKAIALLQKNIDAADNFMNSVLNDVFSDLEQNYVLKSLENVSNIISGYAFKSNDFSMTNEIKSIKITNVGVRCFIENDENKLAFGLLSKLSKFTVNENDIVIALTRPYISNGLKVCFVPNSYDGAFINQRVAAIKSKDEITLNKYIYYYLCTSTVLSNVIELSKTLNQPNLSIKDLSEFELPLAPLPIQHKVVAYLDDLTAQIEQVKSAQQQKMQNLLSLKSSILDQAFHGLL